MQTLEKANFKGWVDDVPPNSKLLFQRLLNFIVPIEQPEILEIGSFTGVSLLSMLDIVKTAHGTAVDPWEPSKDPFLQDRDMSNIENIFDQNVNKSGFRDRVTKIKGDSKKILLTLKSNFYDFIYVDGSHYCLDTYHDLICSWSLLKHGGILVIDDVLWLKDIETNVLNIPYYAVEHFLNTYKDTYDLLYNGYRVAIRKL